MSESDSITSRNHRSVPRVGATLRRRGWAESLIGADHMGEGANSTLRHTEGPGIAMAAIKAKWHPAQIGSQRVSAAASLAAGGFAST